MSFIHAAFLAAGLAIAVPWLLHLTRKRKYLRIRLGSLQFLDPVVRDRHRMSRVEQWPLLIVRCLAVLLLALVFARPFFPKPSPAPPAAGESVILLDASGSVTEKQADAIRKQAAEAIRTLPKSTKAVIAMVSDKVEIIPSLDAYQPIPGSPGGFSQAVDWVVDRAASAPDTMAAVHWFTDLQKSPLPASPSRLWPSGLEVKIHPVLPPTDKNIAVEQIDLLTPFGGDRWEIEARVRVYGMPGTEPLNLALTTQEGKQVTTTAPPEGGTAHFEWEGKSKDGLLTGKVSVIRAGDSWPADDARAFAFPTQEPKRVALVDGDPGDSPFLSETYFLEKALHASAAGKALSPFRATVSPKMPKVEERVDVIALCNIAGLSPANVRLLQTHLEAGTGLVYFMGNNTRATSFPAAAAAGIFPKGLQISREPAHAFLRRSDLTSPILSGMNAESVRALGLVALTHAYTWPADPEWKNVMEFEDASPLLAVSTRQKIAVFAHPANREGSDLPLDQSFVPLIQGIFAHLAASPEAAKKAATVSTTVPGLDERRAPGLYEDEGRISLVTADITESDIANADEKTFREVLGLPALDAPAAELAPPDKSTDSTHQREGEVWPWILALLLTLLILESGLAARRIRQTATPDAHVH